MFRRLHSEAQTIILVTHDIVATDASRVVRICARHVVEANEPVTVADPT